MIGASLRRFTASRPCCACSAEEHSLGVWVDGALVPLCMPRMLSDGNYYGGCYAALIDDRDRLESTYKVNFAAAAQANREAFAASREYQGEE